MGVGGMRRWYALPYVTAAIGIALVSQGFQSAEAVTSTSAPHTSQSVLVAQNVVVALDVAVPLDIAQPDPERAAFEHIRNHSQLLGLSDETFVLKNVVRTIGGISTVRLTQIIEGTPVIGSLLSLTMNSQGALLSYSLRTSAPPNIGVAQLTQAQVVNVAVGELSSRLTVQASDVEIVTSESFIADSATLSDLSGGSHVVWRVRALVAAQPTELYIDDATSNVLAISDVVDSAVGDVTPLICNWESTTSAPVIGDTVGRHPNVLCDDTSSVITEGSGTIQASERQRLTDGIDLATQFFSNYLNVDVRDEHYLGNISPQLNYSDGTKPIARTACTAAG
ncbi:MAG: hypothetical protein F2839_06945, partial [Actinobacteria bacterium]|nr:hypothetical protein [Actinomycetota bacterium]